MSFMSDLRSVRELVRPEASNYALGLSALFLVNLADAFAPVFMAVAVDLTEAALADAAPKTPPLLTMVGLDAADFTIVTAVLCYLFILIVANVSRYPMLMYTAVPSHRIGQTLRNRLNDHLLRLSQSFYDRSKTGDLMSLATADINAVRMMVGPGILVGSDTLFIVALVLAVMFGLSWQLTLIAMIPMPFIYLFTNKMSHYEYERFEVVQEDIAELTERARESYAGIRIIQGYARERFDRARFQEYSWGHYIKNMNLARIRSTFDPTLDFFIGLSISLVFIFGGVRVVEGTMTLGTFVAFIFLVGYLAGPMMGFGWSVSLFQRGRASYKRLDRLWQTEIEIADAADAQPLDGDIHIVVKDLSFAYTGPKVEDDYELGSDGEGGGSSTAKKKTSGEDEPATDAGPISALHDIDFEIPSGQVLGVLGPVGSGKSTLAKLLVRLYEPPEGTVLINGHDVRDIGLEALRRQIVLAPQDTFLFSDTVARNVLMASPDDDAVPEEFTELASLHSELQELEEGYDTMLGERGVNLSGGQRQRLAIARAIASKPSMLILDDCLSAVDARTEEAILGNLRRVFDGRSGMIISHRVRAVQRCDQIIVLDAGRVIERGTHDELVAKGGYYARIHAEQTDAAGASHAA